VNQKGKRTPTETPPTRGLDGPVRVVLACGDSEASGSRLGQRLSEPQGRPGRKRRKEIFELKIGLLNLPTLWKFAQADLGGILT
jgi:hypothetical protein